MLSDLALTIRICLPPLCLPPVQPDAQRACVSCFMCMSHIQTPCAYHVCTMWVLKLDGLDGLAVLYS